MTVKGTHVVYRPPREREQYAFMVGEPVAQVTAPHVRVHRIWWRVLLGGLLLYILGIVILIVTHNPNLFPTVILLGSFLVPVCYVTFFYERQHLVDAALPDVALSFFCGGVLGTFAAGVLEPFFIRQMTPLSAVRVGLIEEGAKIVALMLLAWRRRLRHNSELDGVILGAAAGMGFAALESMGYAFSAFLQSQGSLSATVGITLLRGLLAPVGHGTWTAILAGVLFRESGIADFRVSGRVLLAYLGVSLLHGLWDGLPPLVEYVTGSGLDVLIAQVIVGLIGFVWLWRVWRQGLQRAVSEATVPATATAAESGV